MPRGWAHAPAIDIGAIPTGRMLVGRKSGAATNPLDMNALDMGDTS